MIRRCRLGLFLLSTSCSSDSSSSSSYLSLGRFKRQMTSLLSMLGFLHKLTVSIHHYGVQQQPSRSSPLIIYPSIPPLRDSSQQGIPLSMGSIHFFCLFLRGQPQEICRLTPSFAIGYSVITSPTSTSINITIFLF